MKRTEWLKIAGILVKEKLRQAELQFQSRDNKLHETTRRRLTEDAKKHEHNVKLATMALRSDRVERRLNRVIDCESTSVGARREAMHHLKRAQGLTEFALQELEERTNKRS